MYAVSHGAVSSLKCGILQGSCLEPLFFSQSQQILTTKLARLVHDDDDSTLYYITPSHKKLNDILIKELNVVCDWTLSTSLPFKMRLTES